MTRTKILDRNGNISYMIHDGNELLGVVARLGSKYHAVNRNGGWAPASSIRHGEQILALWKRLTS